MQPIPKPANIYCNLNFRWFLSEFSMKKRLNPFQPFQSHSDLFRPASSSLNPLQPIWISSNLFESVPTYLNQFQPIWIRSNLIESVPTHSWLFLECLFLLLVDERVPGAGHVHHYYNMGGRQAFITTLQQKLLVMLKLIQFQQICDINYWGIVFGLEKIVFYINLIVIR